MGRFNGYSDPRVGAEFHLDLSQESRLKKLTFKPLPGDLDLSEQFYIPLTSSNKIASDGTSVGNPLVVESLTTYSDDKKSFQRMRLISQSNGPNPRSVKVDVVPKGRRGEGPNFVQIWITVESDVVEGVALIEGHVDGPFPGQNKK